MALLYLGSCDKGKVPSNRSEFLKPYHIDGILTNKVTFRDDDRTKWRLFREGDGTDVVSLQHFLHDAGFMPRANFDGVFGYVTQAATRLFQEYVRTMENIPGMIPDGIVGKGTQQHISRWKQESKTSTWSQTSVDKPTQHYEEWMQLLTKAKRHYLTNPGPVLKYINALQSTYATIKVEEWNFNPNGIHLIGVRRNQAKSVANRDNDDLFFLLINGMVFTFWGSTDPSAKMSEAIGVKHEAFLVEGQHTYRFGWHKIWNDSKIYRALKPHDPKGVIIVRDWDRDDSFTDADVKKLEVNNSINIHWTGVGKSNFSAGCQVIAGKSYINNNNELQDCSKFASTSYSGLTKSQKKTKGAYNVFTDLVLCYAPQGVTQLQYTLGREESLNIDAKFGSNYAVNALKRMKSV